MKKVFFTVTKAGKNERRMSGVGYILNDKDLLIPVQGNNGKMYIKILEDCIKYCHKAPNATNEYKGTYWEIVEIEFEASNGSGFVKKEIERTYYVWYKLAE